MDFNIELIKKILLLLDSDIILLPEKKADKEFLI